LNTSLGRQIDTFLERIVPGNAWERANWGLSLGAELNRHPKLRLPRIEAETALEDVYMRVEHQVFFRLPRTLGVLFGIRLSLHPLGDLLKNRRAAAGLARALETMSDEVAAYKGLDRARTKLLSTLNSVRAAE
jgi:hypothetical protein